MRDTTTLREVAIHDTRDTPPYIEMSRSVELAVAKRQVQKTIFCKRLHEWELVYCRFPIVHLTDFLLCTSCLQARSALYQHETYMPLGAMFGTRTHDSIPLMDSLRIMCDKTRKKDECCIAQTSPVKPRISQNLEFRFNVWV